MLRSTVDLGPEGKDDDYGHGYVNMKSAYDILMNKTQYSIKIKIKGPGGVYFGPGYFDYLRWSKDNLAYNLNAKGNHSWPTFEKVYKLNLLNYFNYYSEERREKSIILSSISTSMVAYAGDDVMLKISPNSFLWIFHARLKYVEENGKRMNVGSTYLISNINENKTLTFKFSYF